MSTLKIILGFLLIGSLTACAGNVEGFDSSTSTPVEELARASSSPTVSPPNLLQLISREKECLISVEATYFPQNPHFIMKSGLTYFSFTEGDCRYYVPRSMLSIQEVREEEMISIRKHPMPLVVNYVALFLVHDSAIWRESLTNYIKKEIPEESGLLLREAPQGIYYPASIRISTVNGKAYLIFTVESEEYAYFLDYFTIKIENNRERPLEIEIGKGIQITFPGQVLFGEWEPRLQEAVRINKQITTTILP